MKVWWLFFAGCAGGIDNPDAFLSTDQQALFSCDPTFDVPALVTDRCAGCHNTADLQGGLDLSTGDFAMHLLGVASTECNGRELVDPSKGFTGYLFEKLTRSRPACGVQMPLGGRLTTQEINCLRSYLTAEAARTFEAAP